MWPAARRAAGGVRGVHFRQDQEPTVRYRRAGCVQLERHPVAGLLVGRSLALDVNVLNHAFVGEAPGQYTWSSVVTGVGQDVFNSANWISLDDAAFTKN